MMLMPDQESNIGQRDGGNVVSAKLVVAGGDGPEAVKIVEEAFDELALR